MTLDKAWTLVERMAIHDIVKISHYQSEKGAIIWTFSLGRIKKGKKDIYHEGEDIIEIISLAYAEFVASD